MRTPQPKVSSSRWVRVRTASIALCLGLVSMPAQAIASSTPTMFGFRNAAPTPEEKAQQRYQAGLSAFEAGRYEEAVAAFEEAFELAGDPTLLYNVSIAYEKAGKLDKALETLNQYAELAPESEQEEIKRQRKALELRIEKANSESGEPQPTDETTTGANPSEPKPTRRDTKRDKPVPERVFTPLASSLLGVSVVSLGVGVGLAIPAAQANRRVRDECTNVGSSFICQDTTAPAVSQRRNLAIGADVSFAIGAATGVAAITLLVMNAIRIRRARREAATAVLAPIFVPRGPGRTTTGLALTKRF